MDATQARLDMIAKQIRSWLVSDSRLLQAIQDVPREHFLPEEYKNFAYADIEIPLKHNQMMLTPKLIAKILEGLHFTGTESVLEIGTGSGYVTALLSILAKEVVSYEYYQDLSNQAQVRLEALHIANVKLEYRDVFNRFPLDKKYDAIICTGSVLHVPQTFLQCLNPGGILLIPCGKEPLLNILKITKENEYNFKEEILFETYIMPLIGGPTEEWETL